MKKKKPFWKRLIPTMLTNEYKKDKSTTTGPKEKVKRGFGLKIKF